jgi:hypothetical protein
VIAFHGLDDSGLSLSLKVALMKDRMAAVFMVWKQKVINNVLIN